VYVPRHFAEDDLAAKHALIEAYGFGILALTLDDGIEAAHLPFLLERGHGELGALRAHVARANPIWRAFDSGREALAVFLGPHAYVSPDWYASADQVPTWNYTAVHAYGTPRVLEGDGLAYLAELSARNEAELAPKAPWTLDKMPAEKVRALAKGVVAFEIEITRLEGKAKLGQNRDAEDVAGAAAGLRARGRENDLAVAELMEAPRNRA
jgi:transcriptional regulator